MVAVNRGNSKSRSFVRVGSVIDKYEVKGLLGRGGRGYVYLVEDLDIKSLWAMKEVPIVNTPEGRQKLSSFMYEVELLKELNYPSIPRITSLMNVKTSVLLVMDYISGRSLGDLMSSVLSREPASGLTTAETYITEKNIISWATTLCKTLQYLHSRPEKIIYRDMKPNNVMLTSSGDIVLLDFGASRKIVEGFDFSKEPIEYSRGYAAPEQYSKDAWFDERSDIFGLGRTLYYLATGLNPTLTDYYLESGEVKLQELSKLDDPSKVMPFRPIREYAPTRSEGLEKIILKATMLKPEDRYQHIEEMLYDLKHIDELSSNHIRLVNKRKRVITGLFSTLVLGSVLLFGGYLSSNLSSINNYQAYYANGKTTGNLDDLYKAISIEPNKVEPYLAILDIYKDDGVYTPEEELKFLSAIQPYISSLKADKDAGDLMYDIGLMYWYYYKDGGQLKSVSWFKLADSYGVSSSNKDLLSVYLGLGTFKKGILNSITDKSDKGMYKSYWVTLAKLRGIMKSDVRLELLYYQSLYDVIDSYSGGLKSDGYSYDDLNSVLAQSKDALSSLSLGTDSDKEQQANLISRFDTVQTKLNTTFGIR